MNPYHDDDRISGYLDGELTADEQARFEEELARNAELRQVVDELRAMRSDLDLLPRMRLENDFAAQVLRRAEREVLAGGATGEQASKVAAAAKESPRREPAAASRTPAPELTAPRWSRERAKRPLMWSAAAIAAAVMVMLFSREEKHNEVAQMNQQRAAEHRFDGPLPQADVSAPGDSVAKNGELPAANRTRDVADMPAGGGAGGNRLVADPQFGGRELKKAASFAKPQVADDARPAIDDRQKTPISLRAAERDEKVAGAPEEKEAAANAPVASPAKDVAGAKANSGERSGANLEQQAATANGAAGPQAPAIPKPAAPLTARSMQVTKSPAPLELNTAAADKSGSWSSKGEARSTGHEATKTFRTMARRGVAAATTIVVADCSVAPDAADGAFTAMLTHRGIQWRSSGLHESAKRDIGRDDAAQGKEPAESLAEDEKLKSREAIAPAPAAPMPIVADGLPPMESPRGQTKIDADVVPSESVIYVEASPAQIKSLIDDLQSQPETFRSLTVTAAADGKALNYGDGEAMAHDDRAAKPGEAGASRAAGGEGQPFGVVKNLQKQIDALAAPATIAPPVVAAPAAPPQSGSTPAAVPATEHTVRQSPPVAGKLAALPQNDKAKLADQAADADAPQAGQISGGALKPGSAPGIAETEEKSNADKAETDRKSDEPAAKPADAAAPARMQAVFVFRFSPMNAPVGAAAAAKPAQPAAPATPVAKPAPAKP